MMAYTVRHRTEKKLSINLKTSKKRSQIKLTQQNKKKTNISL